MESSRHAGGKVVRAEEEDIGGDDKGQLCIVDGFWKAVLRRRLAWTRAKG